MLSRSPSCAAMPRPCTPAQTTTRVKRLRLVHLRRFAAASWRCGRRCVAAQHLVAVQKLHAQARAGLRQAVGELVDVAGGVALGVVATVVLALQRGFNGAHLVRRDRAALQAACGQQGGHCAGVVKARLVAVDVQDAFALVVEVNAFCLGPAKQVLARGNGQARGGDGVVAVAGYGGHKLGHPAQLVPGGRGVHQERARPW